MAMAGQRRVRGSAGGTAAGARRSRADAAEEPDPLQGDWGEPASPAELARMDARYRRIMGHDVAAEMDRLIDEGIERDTDRIIDRIIDNNIAKMGDRDAHARLLGTLTQAWLQPYSELR